MKISVLTPTYKSLPILKETLDSLFKQTYQNFELIICNDSNDEKELKEFLDKNYKEFESKIIFEQNQKNLGYSFNIKKCFDKSSGEIIFLLAQDDIIIDSGHFQEIINIYKNYPSVGFTSRPYFWFDYEITNILRRVPKSNKRIIKNNDPEENINVLMNSIGQLSGLTFKRLESMNYKFSPHIFTAHVYPFMQNFLISDCYFFEKDTIAVRMSSSQTTFLSSIYNPSPTLTWVQFSNEVFKDNDYLKNLFISGFTQNYLGLVQIKNYGYFKDLLSDIYYLIKFRSRNLINLKFWFFVIGVLLIPRKLLIYLVNFYKNKVNKKLLKS